MAIFNTINKDYIIELTRKDFKLWNTNKSFKYLCKILFKNNLNIPLLEITTNEESIFNIIDCLNQFLEFNMGDIVIPINNMSTSLTQFIFKLERDFSGNMKNSIIFAVGEYNSYHQQMIDRIKIQFDEESLYNFMDIMYFSFLIDIDSNRDIMDYMYNENL